MKEIRLKKRDRHEKQTGEEKSLWLGDFLKSFFMLVCIHSDFDSLQSQFNSRHAIYNA